MALAIEPRLLVQPFPYQQYQQFTNQYAQWSDIPWLLKAGVPMSQITSFINAATDHWVDFNASKYWFASQPSKTGSACSVVLDDPQVQVHDCANNSGFIIAKQHPKIQPVQVEKVINFNPVAIAYLRLMIQALKDKHINVTLLLLPHYAQVLSFS